MNSPKQLIFFLKASYGPNMLEFIIILQKKSKVFNWYINLSTYKHADRNTKEIRQGPIIAFVCNKLSDSVFSNR